MSAIDQITKRRLNAMSDNTQAKPLEVLQLIIDDIEKGEIKPDGMYVILIDRSNDEIDTSTFLAGLKWEEQFAYLQLEITKITLRKLK